MGRLYYDQTIQPLTSSFVFFNFVGSAKVIILANDDISGPNKIQFSWYGEDVDGSIPYSQAVTLEVTHGNGMYLRYANGAPDYRVIVRGN
jgi:hypothetical protein